MGNCQPILYLQGIATTTRLSALLNQIRILGAIDTPGLMILRTYRFIIGDALENIGHDLDG